MFCHRQSQLWLLTIHFFLIHPVWSGYLLLSTLCLFSRSSMFIGSAILLLFFAKLLKSFHILALPYYLLHLPSNILHQYSIQKPKMFHISHLFWWRDVRIKSHFASKLLSVLYIHLSITTQGLLLSLVSFSIKSFFRRKESSLSIVRFDMPNSFANLVAVMSPSTLR